MLRTTTAFIIISAVVQFASAQITITSNDILGLIGSEQVGEYDSSSTITVNVGTAGENQSWDFTANSTNMEYTLSFLTPQETPFNDDFPQANFVTFSDLSQADTIYHFYSYATITSSKFLTLGSGNIINIPNEYDTSYATFNEDETPLPLTYGQKWEVAQTDTVDFTGYVSITTEKSSFSVDAWGTVTLPSGTYDCLRLREDYVSSSVWIIGGNEIPTDTVSKIIYTWLSKDNYLICDIESQNEETNPEFTNASYFSRLKSTTTSIDDDLTSVAVGGFSLKQNYPNPFNPVTVISYRLGKADQVKLNIYDSAGRHVQTLVDSYQSSGQHSVQWNAEGLASGVYYYRLQNGTHTEIRKAILLK